MMSDLYFAGIRAKRRGGRSRGDVLKSEDTAAPPRMPIVMVDVVKKQN